VAKKETASQKKVHKVMKEFKGGSLHIGKSQKLVKDKSQAIAIAISEGKKASKK